MASPKTGDSQRLQDEASRAAEAGLVTTHEQTRQVLERITDGFYALDTDWRFVYLNEAGERLIGKRRDELIGVNLWQAYPAVAETPLYAALHRAMAEAVTETIELYYPPLDTWYDVRAYPSPDGLSVFFRDITAQRKLAEDLQASEEKYRTLVEHLPAVTYLLDTDEIETALFYSPRIAELTGFNPEEETMRTRGLHWIETVHPDDRARVMAEDLRSFEAGEPFRMEYRYARKDGSYVWVHDECVPVHDASGNIVAWQGILLDVDARVRAEEERGRLAAIVESAEDGILSCTLDGTITSWNKGAEQLYGYTAEEAIGRSVAMLRPPELSGDIAEMVAGVHQGASIQGHETVRQAKDGRRVEVSLSLSPIRNSSGEIVGIASISRDIALLRQAQHALRLRERALAAAPSGIAITDANLPDVRIVDVNPAFERMTGYAREEVIGRGFSLLNGPATDVAVVQRINEAFSAGREITETILNYRKDGTPIWVELHTAVVRDEDGALTNFVEILSDVTEHVRAEAALAQERDLLRTLLEHLPDAVYIKDTESRFVQLNVATAHQLGVDDPAQVIGKTDRDFFSPAKAAEFLADEQRIFATGEPMLNKAELQTEGDEQRWVLATKAPLRNADGQIIGLVGINRDVTDRILAEEARGRLAAIVESAEDAIISRTLDGIITSWNRGAEHLYGYTAEEAIGQSFAMLLPDDALPTPLETEAFGAPFTQFEARRRRKDGSLVDVSIAMSPIRDDAGATVGVSTITRDITERKQVELHLQEALQTAQAATRTKSLFLAMMSHELRTPLQAVLGYADLLALGEANALTAEQTDDVQHIRQGAQRMIALIDQMLDLSRMEAGRLELVSKPVDLAEIVEQVRADVAPQAAEKALAIEIDVPATLPRVLADPGRLRQILLNLAGNAVKFTEQGIVCLTARAAGDEVEIEVRDTGIGVSAEALPYIFEEFRQVDGSLTRKYGGAGLGLAIARRLAEQMHGSLTATSQLGVGSVFTLRLPTAKPRQRRSRGRRGSDAAEAADTPSWSAA